MAENEPTPMDKIIEKMTMEELRDWAKVGLVTTTYMFKKAVDTLGEALKNGK